MVVAGAGGDPLEERVPLRAPGLPGARQALSRPEDLLDKIDWAAEPSGARAPGRGRLGLREVVRLGERARRSTRGLGVHYARLLDAPSLASDERPPRLRGLNVNRSESPEGDTMAAKLYVGGLSYSTTSETLREYFAQCGTVESASVVTDKFSGQSRGFGFVEMATAEEAQRAISELNGKELDGRKLTVNVSNPAARPGGGGGGPRRRRRPAAAGPAVARRSRRRRGRRGAYGVPPSKKPFRW